MTGNLIDSTTIAIQHERYEVANPASEQARSPSTVVQSVLSDGATIVIRTLRAQTVTIPFDVEGELAKRANREANGSGSAVTPSTDNLR